MEEQTEYISKHELTDKEKIITDPLPHFMPMWTARVLDGDESGDIEYTNSARCLVGEAHGMSRSYADDKEMSFINKIIGRPHSCKYCNSLSFGRSGKTVNGTPTAIEASHNKEAFIKFKKEMYRHMQTKHKKEFKKLWLQQ